MVDKNQKRPSTGDTAGDEVVRDEVKEFATPDAVQLPEERARKFRTTGFSRMRTEWQGEDRLQMQRVTKIMQAAHDEMFEDAELILYNLLIVVREPQVDEDGNIMPGPDGLPLWRRNNSGSYVEDWTKLTSREREKFLFQITTNLYLWEQRAADVWGEAMFAKAIWEEKFSIGYESLEGTRPTIDDRTARGKIEAASEKYFALYVSWLSRKADALVRTMTLLSQRLKDVHTNGS